jgi:3-oxoacyl-[acyl-carrier protein] reductase
MLAILRVIFDRQPETTRIRMRQIAIITGASAGIGIAAAAAFRDAGFGVLNLSRRVCPVEGVQDIRGDLADPDATKAVAAELSRELRRAEPDRVCLIHNAALMLKDGCDSCADADLQRVLQINVAAVNTLNRELIPLMGPGSSVLYVGSTLAEKAVANSFSYVVSKHAQLGMMRATCQDLMGRGIHTAMIAPGFTDTEMLRTHVGDAPATIDAISGLNSYGRLVRPEEIAAVLRFAHENPAINGTIIHANLGQREN